MNTQRLSRGTVLVIDHDARMRPRLAEFLVEEGYSVEEAGDAENGLRIAEQDRPDVILLALTLPVHSSLDVLQRLRARHPTREIPVIIVSAYAMLLVGDALARANHLMQPPFDLRQMLVHVNRLVRDADPAYRLLPPMRASA